MLPYFREEGMLKPEDMVRDKKEMPFSMIATWQTPLLRAADKLFGLKQISTFHCGLPCPVYEIKVERQSIGIVNLPIGAPISAGFMEEYAIRGVMQFIFIGYAGILNPRASGKIIVPTQVYRDEGTSWHYAPHDSPWIDVRSAKKLDDILTEMEIPHICGRVWSTDAFYRETPSAVKMMKEQQCLCVDMECSANMAVAQMRNLQCYQMLFGGDSLEGDEWKVGKLRRISADKYATYAMIAAKVALA
jgi:Uridine phosphorylase